MYQRAVTGELQRAIESIDAVKSAKVLLVMPEEVSFLLRKVRQLLLSC